ncbi:hypothetical protein [Paenibacillus antarcticus]|uniref:2TM domain-containing protein n=1 Tax=Paenibacillus antarcticus TaxID=253703 RepID=A0A168NGC7_9BACL|nr:hypothetical protein [Paenibacillus antarcticus]OAB45770.1 hypothetical protein PBAT_12760 [Paenibacillus antarcticus]
MNWIMFMIIGCEIAFWVFILLGLICRYILKMEKLGLVLLSCTPVIDLILLIVTGLDLYRGAIATTAHALAAVYIGVSIGFGRSMIGWVDARFKYYVTKQGKLPNRLHGKSFAKHYSKGFVRHIVAYVIGCGLLMAILHIINDASRTEALSNMMKIWSIIVGVDLMITASYFMWPRQEKRKT